MKRFKNLLTIVLVVILADFEFASADGPAIQWEKTFGGSDREYGNSVQQTSNGGYVITGMTKSLGDPNGDVYLIKTDQKGNTQWEKTFGGSDYDVGLCVQQTSDDGYIIAGRTYSFGAGSYDVYVIKTDPNGNSVWQKTFGGSSDDWSYSVQQTSDGGYIIAGTTYSFGADGDVYLIKTDPNGKFEWQKTFGGSGNEEGHSVQQTIDGGYIITGPTNSFGAGSYDIYLIKTDPNGDSQWQKTFGGIYLDDGGSVHQAADGGYIITGWTRSFGAGAGDVYLIKTDPNGNIQWQKTFGGSNDDVGSSVDQAADGGYIIAGYTNSFGEGDFDVYLIKTDPNGNIQWQKTFGGSNDDLGGPIQQTSDGGYIIAGYTNSFGKGDFDVYLIKLSRECKYVLFGDLNDDCRVDFYDFALMATSWLIDCNIDPNNPACIPK